jgi:AraC-like DNA-binding protein
LLFGDRRLSFETLDFLWTIAPFSVRFCDFKPQSRSLSIHKDIEFHYVFEGEEIYILNGKEQRISKGELVCVNSYTPHNYYSLVKGRSVTVIVSADYLTKNGLNLGSLCFEEYVKDSMVGEKISELLGEFNASDAAHGVYMNALILSFVAYIARAHSRASVKSEGSEGLERLGSAYQYVCQAIDYISENFANNIALDELSALCGLSKYHLLRIFKQVTGHTPIDYINKVRCKYATQRLLNGASVTETALASGFSDAHYFSNCFKKYIGCRPSEIRKRTFENDI